MKRERKDGLLAYSQFQYKIQEILLERHVDHILMVES